MLELSSKLTLDADTIKAPNLTDRFSEEDLVKLGEHIWEGYARDKQSRSKWERRTQAGMDLAMQVVKEKSFPWPGASNVAFPLITIASLQFHSRAYPALISGVDVVKCRVIGDDDTGQKTARATRISQHMSWQKLEEQKEWEPQKDMLLINLPIVGTCFTKSYNDAERAHNVDETVLAQDLVIDYWAKSVETAPRKTHIIPQFRNDLHSKILRGMFRNVRDESWYSNPPAPASQSQAQAQVDNRQGKTPPQADETAPFITLEQHVDLDLDDDGYAEPYIVTIEESTHTVLRIVCGFDREEDIERNVDGDIISVRRMEYFTRYVFIPSPDGGIYGVGFGVLLGPLNESTNSLINQLIDAGTMQNAKGGFLGKGAKIRGGTITFAPLQWHRVDATGDDLRKSIVPLEAGQPSDVLLKLLSILINYVERISGTTDTQVGENPGQNTPAENMRTMVAEGQRVYSAVFKRIWVSMKEEFKKGYILNGIYLPVKKAYAKGKFGLREDYLGNPDEVCPAADPNVTSDAMRLQQAIMLKQSAASTPGYDMDAVERRFLRAMKVDAIEEVFPGTAKTGQREPEKITIQKMKLQGEQMWMQHETTQFVLQLQEEQRMNNAEIAKIEAEIADMRETQQGDKADRQIGLMDAVLGTLKTRNDIIMKHMDVLIKRLELMRAHAEANAPDAGDDGGLEGTPSNRSGAKGTRTPKTSTAGAMG